VRGIKIIANDREIVKARGGEAQSALQGQPVQIRQTRSLATRTRGKEEV